MPSKEGLREHHEEQPQEPNREREQPPYSRTASFAREKPAAKAYFHAQEVIFRDEESELSAYRLLLNAVYHVTVLGEQPSQETDQALARILSKGKIATLPSEILAALNARRLEMKQQSEWVEAHYRPGAKLDY